MNTVSRTFLVLFGALIFSNILLLAYVSYIFLVDCQTRIHAHRIDVRDSSGKGRLVISNEQNIPGLVIGKKNSSGHTNRLALSFARGMGTKRVGSP